MSGERLRQDPWNRGIVIYSVLALAAFAFPGGLVSWLEDRYGKAWIALPLAVAKTIDAASTAVGVKLVGSELRRRSPRSSTNRE